jgi:hypothetical protein
VGKVSPVKVFPGPSTNARLHHIEPNVIALALVFELGAITYAFLCYFGVKMNILPRWDAYCTLFVRVDVNTRDI